MPQIWPLPVHSVEVSWQSPATHWPARQMCIAPYWVSFLHWVSPAVPAVQATQAWLTHSWLLPHSAELLQAPEMHAPADQTWFVP